MSWARFAVHLEALEPLGWALVLAVWQTTLMALLVWGYYRTGRGTSPSRRHAAALGALVAAAFLATGTWWGLEHAPAVAQVVPLPAGLGAAAQTSTAVPTSALSLTHRSGIAEFLANSVRDSVPWLAVVWIVAVGVLFARLAGGVLLTRWIRRHATPLLSGSVPETARRLARTLGMRQSVEVLESAEVDSPATTGWRRPALIVPCGLDLSLSPPHLDPVIVHELEHLRRGDQWVAVVQAVPDALFFYCPGARWLSNQARETREQRCDDTAVQACGSAKDYASALAVLASRATGAWLTAVIGAQAPSLASRIRRLLKGEAMPVMNRVKAFGLIVAVVVTIASGAFVLAASVEQVRLTQAMSPGQPSAQNSGQTGTKSVPTAYVTNQLGSPVSITHATGTSEYAFTRVGLRNVSEQRIVSVTFVAVVEHRNGASPAILVVSDPVATALEPGQAGDVAVALLPNRDVLEWKESRGVRAQAMLGVIKVAFSEGDDWAITPPAGATTSDEVFFLPPGMVVSRALLSGPQVAGRPDGLCRNDAGRSYSEGALVRIRGEKDAVARCTDGRWVEQKAPRP